MKRVFLFVFILLFAGCSSKVSEVFQKDKTYITLMQYTKRGEIVKSLETIALINATYINPILKDSNKSENYEVFIIGVYNSNDYRGYKKGGIFNPNYSLTMNGEKFVKAEKADKVKLGLENYPFYNKWMKYYEVYFPKSDSFDLDIEYKFIPTGDKTTLTIEKDIYDEEE
jgi:hypothetical protein